MEPLVTPEWLAGQLGTPGLMVFDATFYLAAEGRDARAEFRAAHIPAAQFFDIGIVADPDTTLPHMVPSAGRFQMLLRAMGVSDDTRVVFYDQKGVATSPRGWWLMGLFGHDRVAVLDGGLPGWVAAGHATEAGDAPVPAPGMFTARLRTDRLRGLGDMLDNAPALILDARSGARFTGAEPEPRPGLPGGHMPGARNIPSSSVATGGRMLPPAELRRIFEAVGDDGTRPVVTTCGSGVTATVLTFARTVAGLPPGAVYDGSWTEWALTPGMRKETS